MILRYTNLHSFGPSSSQFDNLLTILPLPTQARILRFRQEEDKLRSLLGWLLLWKCVKSNGWELKGETLEGSMGVSKHGKPEFLDSVLRNNQLDIDHNIAHDSNLIFFGASSSRLPRCLATSDSTPFETAIRRVKVGIDCMKLDRPQRELEGLEEVLLEQMTPEEIRSLSSIPKSTTNRNRTDHLLTIWTLKEAYIKAIGAGLSMDLKRINLSFPPRDLASSPENEIGGQCDTCSNNLVVRIDDRDLTHEQEGNWHVLLRKKTLDEAAGGGQYLWAAFWSDPQGCQGWEIKEVHGLDFLEEV